MTWRWSDEPTPWDYLPDVEATYWFAPIWSDPYERDAAPRDDHDRQVYGEMVFCEVGTYVPAHFSGAIPLKAETPESAKVEAAMIWHRWEATPLGRREADGYRVVDNMHSRIETRHFRGPHAPGGRDTNPRQLPLPRLPSGRT